MANGSDILGINGFGRIGKLSLWLHVAKKHFSEVVVNVGREAGSGFDNMVDYLSSDSTYGTLSGFINGFSAENVISGVDPVEKTLEINGVRVKFLTTHRNPADIGWHDHGVELVLDTTGVFKDPTASMDTPGGSVRGHLASGAEKVIVSAPFKISDKSAPMPEDAVTTVMGINDSDYDPARHKIISNASCTTTCLAHMIKPLLDYFGEEKILTASMATIHAATGSQQVLDRMPGSGSSDLRKNRSVINNIILTTTGAAKALGLVIPEMKRIGFIAESVRIPTTTGSLIILVLNFQDKGLEGEIRREIINDVYRKAAETDINRYLIYSEKQNVSSDIIGTLKAGAVIEGNETHTRSAGVKIDLKDIPGVYEKIKNVLDDTVIQIPVTQAVVYGWYDNELAGYVNMLYDRTVSISESIRF